MANTGLHTWLAGIGHKGRIAGYTVADQRLIIEGDHLTPGDSLSLRDGRRVIVVVVDDVDFDEAPDEFVPKDVHDEVVEQNKDLRDVAATLRKTITDLRGTLKSNGIKS